MLIATQSKSIDSAVKYFDAELSQGDYYLGSAINATWHGKAASLLGFAANTPVTREDFKSLLSGVNPTNGDKLAQRIRKDRRPGMDLTFSMPKSLSIAYAILKDERILAIFREAVHETMSRDVEPLVCRRVRQGKHASSNQRTPTGNLIYADFVHLTARPINGIVDPHTHAHCFLVNYTQDAGVHYAADLEEVVRQRPKLQACFHARLATKLSDAGYPIEKVTFRQSGVLKEGFELKGVARSTIEKFSNRTGLIEDTAKERGITDAAKKGKLGGSTREEKTEGQTLEELRAEWRSRLTPEEQAVFAALMSEDGSDDQSRGMRADAETSAKYALDHHLYRQSTIEKHQVVATALEHGLFLSPDAVEDALRRDGIIHRSDDVRGAKRHFITTRAVLDAETEMIRLARDGRGRRMMLGRGEHTFKRDWLNDEQKHAVEYLLTSRDSIMAVVGGAGTGKSSLAIEAKEAIEMGGKKVYGFAPSTAARDVLEEKGFDHAQTVEHLIRNERLHEDLRGQVLWIDEAGLLDVRSMLAVLKIADQQNCRVILSGDPKQHGAVGRGEALRLLRQEAGLQATQIDTIQRQRGQYRRAVELLSLGHTLVDAKRRLTGLAAGFDLLDKMGHVREINSDTRYDTLASDYHHYLKKGKTPLVVAPSHAEGQAVTEAIRSRLRAAGAIGKEQVELSVLKSLNLSEAEKGEIETFKTPGLVVQFHQNLAGGIKKGSRFHVVQSEEGVPRLLPVGGGKLRPVPCDHAERFEVYSETETQFAAGDRVRFTLGGTSKDGTRIVNGRIDQIKEIAKNGNLVLKSGITVARDHGHVDLAYYATSHNAQGQDADVTLAAVSSMSLPVVNARQAYVTASRGKETCIFYVDCKETVRRAIHNVGEQLSATELLKEPIEKARAVQQQRNWTANRLLERVRAWWRSQRTGRSHGDTPTVERPQTPSPTMTPELGRS